MRPATPSSLAFAALAAACSLTTSFDGLTGGAADAGDATHVRDAGGDADVVGGGDATDAGEGGADAGRGAFCATRVPAPSFCDDFERDTDVVGPWDHRIGPSAEVTLDTSPAGSRELQVAIPEITAGGSIAVGLARGLANVASDFRLFYRLRLDAPPADVGMQIVTLEVTNGAGYYHVGLIVQSDGVYLFEQSFPNGTPDQYLQHATSPAITYGVAHALDLHVTVAPPHITLLVDGASAYDGAAIPFFAAGTPSVTAGIAYAGTPVGALTMHVDDVALTASP